MTFLIIAVFNSFSIFSVNIISLPQEVRGIFVIKAAVKMQNNLPTKIWQYVVSLIYIASTKTTPNSLDFIFYYMGKQVQCLHQIINFKCD
jgi:hypothetical protein